jgi:hypothetical protein
MQTINPARRIMFIVLVLCLFITVVGMACSDNGGANCSSPQDIKCNPLFDNSTLETDVQDWVQDTCRQRPDGTCKNMGEQ